MATSIILSISLSPQVVCFTCTCSWISNTTHSHNCAYSLLWSIVVSSETNVIESAITAPSHFDVCVHLVIVKRNRILNFYSREFQMFHLLLQSKASRVNSENTFQHLLTGNVNAELCFSVLQNHFYSAGCDKKHAFKLSTKQSHSHFNSSKNHRQIVLTLLPLKLQKNCRSVYIWKLPIVLAHYLCLLPLPPHGLKKCDSKTIQFWSSPTNRFCKISPHRRVHYCGCYNFLNKTFPKHFWSVFPKTKAIFFRELSLDKLIDFLQNKIGSFQFQQITGAIDQMPG